MLVEGLLAGDRGFKILDFGLAKLLDRSGSSTDAETFSAHALTGQGTLVGTAPYMSPEQAEGRTLDVRSDIFSFGSVLYEMLTGQGAFAGDTHDPHFDSVRARRLCRARSRRVAGWTHRALLQKRFAQRRSVDDRELPLTAFVSRTG